MTKGGNTIYCANSINLLCTLHNIYLNIFTLSYLSNTLHFVFRLNHSLYIITISGSLWCCAGVYRMRIGMRPDKSIDGKKGILFGLLSDDHDLRTTIFDFGLPILLEHLILFVHIYLNSIDDDWRPSSVATWNCSQNKQRKWTRLNVTRKWH